MKKNVKQINEDQLKNIVAESVKKVLAEKYNPWKREEDENGDIHYPRYDKDVNSYKEKIGKQAQHLYTQIEYFLQTLEHAYPNTPNAKDGKRSVYYNDKELEQTLELAKIKLSNIAHPFGAWNIMADYEY